MRYFAGIIAVFLQAFFPVLNLPVLAVIWFAREEEDAGKVYPLAFVIGLLADLLVGNQLGVFAGAYLVSAWLVFLFKSRFPLNFGILAILLVISQAVFFYARGI